ncbi:hypothetical protein LCI18_004088 [Fusarium solani-melongenae]|uniref:Uncharacterized protein n=1 Tax=Fusarium solani subsp. cucurbitae TaxID=2747967 RepID=A0ACD3YZ60_FUSSC|nr:hypothetical protein LCI18_004088 [Fusarium solani-melongenae]
MSSPPDLAAAAPGSGPSKPQVATAKTTELAGAGADIELSPKRDVEVGEIIKVPENLDLVKVDLFVPFPEHPLLPDEPRPLTFRAVLAGWLLGGLVNASNIYLGLKVGLSNDANMFATVFGFAFLQLCSRLIYIPLLRGAFGPKEHNIIQTVATATGGLSTPFISAVPAMIRLGVMGRDVQGEYWRLVTLTAAAAFFGSAISIPFAHAFIVRMARDLNLVFPTSVAVAGSIRAIHLNTKDSSFKRSFYAIGISLVASLIWTVITQYAKGILWDWYISWWFYAWGVKSAVSAVNWGFVVVEWTPAFIGTGMLVNLNTSCSWLLGYVLGFGIIGPVLVSYGTAVGMPYLPDYPDLIAYKSLSSPDLISAPSPRYWLQWPTIMVMITASMTDVLCHWRLLAKSSSIAYSSLIKKVSQGLLKFDFARKNPWILRNAESPSRDREPVPINGLVKAWQWLAFSFAAAVFSCIILALQYDMNVGLAILTLIMGALFAILAVQCTGQTGTSPIALVSSSSQLIVGGITRSSAESVNQKMMSNLASGGVAGTIAQQVCEMTTDFKIGLFLGTPQRDQWYGQLLGCLPSIFLSPGLFIVFSRAYPCILDASMAATCEFAAPSAASYTLIGSSIIQPEFPIPRSSWVFAISASAFACLVHIARHRAAHSNHPLLAACIPNMAMVGLGILVPGIQYGIAMLVGGLVAHLWNRRKPVSAAALLFPVAAGMIAGESIGGIVNAILNLADVSGSRYGTTLGCPGAVC